MPVLRALRVLMKHNMDKASEHCMAACELILNMLKVCCSSEQGPGDSPALAGEIKVCLQGNSLNLDQSTRAGPGRTLDNPFAFHRGRAHV